MPNPYPATQPLVVTGEDREAARNAFLLYNEAGDMANSFLWGHCDDHPLVRLFAAHVATARQMGREEAARGENVDIGPCQRCKGSGLAKASGQLGMSSDNSKCWWCQGSGRQLASKEIIRAALSSASPIPPRPDGDLEASRCDACSGEGRIEYHAGETKYGDRYVSVSCQKCGGTGLVKALSQGAGR